MIVWFGGIVGVFEYGDFVMCVGKYGGKLVKLVCECWCEICLVGGEIFIVIEGEIDLIVFCVDVDWGYVGFGS